MMLMLLLQKNQSQGIQYYRWRLLHKLWDRATGSVVFCPDILITRTSKQNCLSHRWGLASNKATCAGSQITSLTEVQKRWFLPHPSCLKNEVWNFTSYFTVHCELCHSVMLVQSLPGYSDVETKLISLPGFTQNGAGPLPSLYRA